jgi:hypothetical protein
MMKNMARRYINRISLFVLLTILIAVIWLLALPIFGHANNSYAQSENQAMSASFYYTEPTTQLGSMKVVSNSKIDITTNDIHISGLDTWQGASPLYILALHYTDLNTDDVERRFVFVVKTSLGNPWFVADIPVRDPNGASSDADRTIWFVFDVDKSVLLANPKIRSPWFDEAATSIIEVGITDQKQINITGPGALPEDEKVPLVALFKIEEISIFP